MKQKKMTKKEHKAKISLITLSLMLVTIGILVVAVATSISNRELFIKSLLDKTRETNRIVSLSNEVAKKVDLEVASTVLTTSGNAYLNVKTSSSNPKSFKEYRYYIKESTDDMYVLDAIKVEEQHAYIRLEPATRYDVKVEAVSYSGDTMTSTATGETPSWD